MVAAGDDQLALPEHAALVAPVVVGERQILIMPAAVDEVPAAIREPQLMPAMRAVDLARLRRVGKDARDDEAGVLRIENAFDEIGGIRPAGFALEQRAGLGDAGRAGTIESSTATTKPSDPIDQGSA